MNSRCVLLLALLLGSLPAATPAAPKPILVYYMPWFVARPFSSHWGWHWTMDHFDPELVNPAGERQIASWYYPLIGPYDSADPVVLEYHVLLMKLAGIDGVIVDWYGMDNYLDYGVNNQRTLALLTWTRRAGLKFALCYEDRTIQQEVNGGFIAASNALAHARETLLYAQSNYFADPGYLRWSNRPVLLNFGPQYFKQNAQWQEIFSGLPELPAFFTEDTRLPLGAGAFNWPPMWLSQVPGTGGVLSTVALERYLANFERAGAAWPAFISSAFPRFHDIYQKAGVRDYWGYLGDRGGDTLRDTLRRALTNDSAFALIVTWNDFGEGTVVEPTLEYGYRDLGIIQDFRRLYLDRQFAYRTNDLALATRLYQLRRHHPVNSQLNAELDAAFAHITTNNLAAARRVIDRLEGQARQAAAPDNTAP